MCACRKLARMIKKCFNPDPKRDRSAESASTVSSANRLDIGSCPDVSATHDTDSTTSVTSTSSSLSLASHHEQQYAHSSHRHQRKQRHHHSDHDVTTIKSRLRTSQHRYDSCEACARLSYQELSSSPRGRLEFCRNCRQPLYSVTSCDPTTLVSSLCYPYTS